MMSVRNLRLPRSHSQERGSTTLIAVLVLFALLGLGLLSMRHTYQDMSSVGNLRRATQARFVAEMGAHHAIRSHGQRGKPPASNERNRWLEPRGARLANGFVPWQTWVRSTGQTCVPVLKLAT